MQKIVILMIGILFGVPAWGGDSGVRVDHAWSRATAPGQDSGSVQLSISSKEAAKLVSISSRVAGTAEMHSMVHEDGKMEMRAVESIDLPAGRTVDLGKMGYHLMLLNLKQPLKAGMTVPLALTIEFADKRRMTVEAEAEVMGPGASHAGHGKTDMESMHQHEH